MQSNLTPKYLTQADLTQFAAEIAQATAAVAKGQNEQINKLTTAFNKLREELGAAQNTTAQIVDEDRAILDGVMFNLRYIMEKLGMWDAAGNESEEVKQWKAAKIAEAEQMVEAAKGPEN